jgi:hypothetical protein
MERGGVNNTELSTAHFSYHAGQDSSRYLSLNRGFGAWTLAKDDEVCLSNVRSCGQRQSQAEERDPLVHVPMACAEYGQVQFRQSLVVHDPTN